ncbi:hypothetical protein SEA_KASHFLOW_97 [Mycobacterium phage KashFlow]|nr:hypothetical protein SEA_KASHFLOW_97 [Mycobacterium phage KashFlow]
MRTSRGESSRLVLAECRFLPAIRGRMEVRLKEIIANAMSIHGRADESCLRVGVFGWSSPTNRSSSPSGSGRHAERGR